MLTSSDQLSGPLLYHRGKAQALQAVHAERWKACQADPDGPAGRTWDMHCEAMGRHVIGYFTCKLQRSDLIAACSLGKPAEECGCYGCSKSEECGCFDFFSDRPTASRALIVGLKYHAGWLRKRRA